jgi:hypothetical protein
MTVQAVDWRLPMDISRITVLIPDQKSLAAVLSAAKVEMNCGSPKRDASGRFAVILFGSRAEVEKVAALGFDHEIDPNYGKILKQRQQEVSKVDRYNGGKTRPKGLGVKR